MNAKKVIVVLGLIILVGIVGLRLYKPGSHQTQVNNNAQKPGSSGFNTALHSTSDPTSIWIVVNKSRPLPDHFAPADLVVPDVPLRLDKSSDEMKTRSVAAQPLKNLIDDAKAIGYNLMLDSGYRSQDMQDGLYNYYVSQKGQQAADTDSARPRYSEHQTGLAVDLGRSDHQCDAQQCFADTPEAVWLADNAYKYGFIVRYPAKKTNVTGYEYEPWHLRFVGPELAAELHQTGKTMEELFNLPASPDYQQ